MSKSKQKGTQFETWVAEYCKGFGYPDAERLALKGKDDQGDVRVNRNAHLECKAGNAAHNASYQQCRIWLAEAITEGQRAGVPCYLVVKRKGHGKTSVGLSRVFAWADQGFMVEFTLDDLLSHVIEAD